MKKISKGTTLVEIMLSVILISIVLIFIFNILVDLKEENSLSSKRSSDSISRASYTRIIQNDFINLDLTGVSGCNEGLVCFNFNYKRSQPKKLIVYNDYIIYDNEKWSISTGHYVKEKSKFCYQNSLDNISDEAILNDELVKNYHLMKIFVPASKNASSNRNFDLELTHVSEEPLTISNITLPIKNQNCDNQ